jgi:putative transposase
VEEPLARQGGKHESRWTESIAVGSKAFVENTKAEFGIKAIGREVMGADGVYELRERDFSYKAIFAGENSDLRPENAYFFINIPQGVGQVQSVVSTLIA